VAKGDFVKVKSEIGGVLQTDELKVTGAGGSVEAEWDRKNQLLVVKVLGRTGKTRQAVSFALSAVRSVQEVRRDDD
jgi:hypothetical protein